MASTYLEHTLSAAGTNGNKKNTFSAWLKRAKAGVEHVFYTVRQDSSNYFRLRFNDDDTLNVLSRISGTNYYATTNALFKDISAWYHVVVTYDTTQSTSSDRIKIYVNGVEQSKSASNYPSQDATLFMIASGQPQRVGQESGSGYFDGLMTHVHYTEGYAYAATDFGETDTTSGIWKPKTSPSVTYGTNGFFLKFENSGAMGTDSSGQSNTFTVNGTMTQNVDTPTNAFATWNPRMNSAEDGEWSNANLTIQPNGDAVQIYAPITFPLSKGKWYSEDMITGGNGYGSLGLSGASNISDIFRTGEEPGLTAPSFAFRCINGGIKMNNANTSYGSAPGTSDAILGMAVDIDNKKVWYHVNGTYVTYGGGVGDPANGNYGFDWSSLSDDFGWLHVCGDSENNGYGNWKSNFGSGFFGTAAVASANADANGFGAFEYTVPSGYYAICTKNIKEFG